ncbi:MAG TPA: C25 family cysteine peptidase [Phycisphaerae bacterium]|nr:C25 family cysteine peptidase [Phycisphaerae bacterium]
MAARTRAIISFALAFSLLATGSAYAAQAHQFTLAPDGAVQVSAGDRAAPPQIAVTDNALAGFTVRVDTSELTLAPRETKGGTFYDIQWAGSQRGGAIGLPEYPVIRRLFVAPPGMQVSATVRTGASRALDGAALDSALRITPRQAPLPKLPGAADAAPFDFNAEAYTRSASFPAERAVVEEIGILRGQHLWQLEIRPVSYNPADQTLTVWPDLTVDVTFSGQLAADANFAATPELRERVINPALLPHARVAGGRYLILVASAYQSGITSFAAAKTAQGFNVTTQVVSAGMSNTAIKALVTAWYTGPATQHYVLLVGDTDTIPNFTGGGEGTPATDLPYGCMDAGDDWMPEIPVGRFSVRSAAQLTAIVNKTLYYENGPLADPDYLKRAVFMASTDNSSVSEGTHNYVISNYMDPNGYISDKLYTATYGATTQDTTNSFNAGRFYGIYSGHGGTYSWADGPVFEQSNVNALQNTNMYPFVCSFACITGTYTVDECFTETWSRAANKGAVAIYGSSVNSYWTEDDVLEKRLFDSIFDDTDAVPAEVGPIWNDARVRYITEMGSSATTRRYFEMYNLLGDPSMRFPGACSDAGTVVFDREKYACESVVTVTINDCGLNLNDAVADTLSVAIESDSESGIEQVTLVETDAASAEFTGSIAISTTDAPGVLWVAPGDTLSVKYIDEDDGQGGTYIALNAYATVDCTPPVIGNIHALNIGPREATIAFDGNEPVRGIIHYGTSCASLPNTKEGSGYAINASVTVTGLQDNTTYYYAVDGEDAAGNITSDDNGGACYAFTTPEVPDFFTELFDSADNDLDNISLMFTPNGSNDYYAACAEAITALPTDPTGGTTFSLSDDSYATVNLTGGATVSLYGQSYSTFYPVSNGYIVFGTSQTSYDESIAAHLDGSPKISALYDDLNPSSSGSVSYKQLADRVAVTWLNVPEYNQSTTNTFQIVMYFDGRIEINFLAIAATDGLAGLSAGAGVDPDFLESDLSALGACGPQPPTASGANLVTAANAALLVTLHASDDGLPDPPAALDYIVATLPAHAALFDPHGGEITAAPYTLAAGGNVVEYVPDFNYYGQDSFAFKADDGGVAPDGGESNQALVQILVQARPPVTTSLNLEVAENTTQPITLQGTDPDGDVLDFVITTLPAHGVLADPQAGAITAVPYVLPTAQRVVNYTPDQDYLGSDQFTYHAADGIFTSTPSTVSLFVKAPAPQIMTTALPAGQARMPYGPLQLDVDGGQPPLVWSMVSEPIYQESDLGTSLFAETGVAQGIHGDDVFTWFDLPFSFPFYGVNYDRIRIWTNGFIDFGTHSGSSYSNTTAVLIANRQIAPLWDDLKTTATSQDIFIDASQPGAYTVRWEAGHHSDATALIRVAVTLFADGAIRFDYGPGNTPVTPTVGISNGTGTQYTLSAYNGLTNLGDLNSVLFKVPQDLPEGVTLSTTGMLEGTPLESGTFEPVFRVTDSLGRTDEVMIPLQVGLLRFGDCDFDDDVDLVDYAALQRCFTGADLGPAASGCEMFYADPDSDIDLVDFAEFYGVLNN